MDALTEFLARYLSLEHFLLLASGAILTFSVFNTILLFWLGFTMLLTAARRNTGIWMAAAGLFAGGVFFIDHTALVILDIEAAKSALGNWWHLGWVALVVAPFAW